MAIVTAVEIIGPLIPLTLSFVFLIYFVVKSAKQRNVPKIGMVVFFAFCVVSFLSRTVYTVTQSKILDSIWMAIAPVGTLCLLFICLMLAIPRLKRWLLLACIVLGVAIYILSIATEGALSVMLFITIPSAMASTILFMYLSYKAKTKSALLFLTSIIIFTVGGIAWNLFPEAVYFSVSLALTVMFSAFIIE